MAEPAQLVCWRMELIEISHKELELLGEGEILIIYGECSAFEHMKVSPKEQLWWNSSTEEWENFEDIKDFTSYMKKAKRIYLIVKE